MFVPRTFALHEEQDHGVEPVVIAWGMTLPDGSAIAVDWRHGTSATTAVCSSAARAALLYGAELVWLDPIPPTNSHP